MDIEIKGRNSDGDPTTFFYNDDDTLYYIEVVVTPETLTVRWIDDVGNAVETCVHQLSFIDEASIL